MIRRPKNYTLGFSQLLLNFLFYEIMETSRTVVGFDQMYGKCNKPASEEAHKAAARLVTLISRND